MNLGVDVGFALRTAVLVADASLAAQHEHGEGAAEVLDIAVMRAFAAAIGSATDLRTYRVLDIATKRLSRSITDIEQRSRRDRPVDVAAIAATQSATAFRLFSLALGEQRRDGGRWSDRAVDNPAQAVISSAGTLAVHASSGSIERLRFCLATTRRALAQAPDVGQVHGLSA